MGVCITITLFQEPFLFYAGRLSELYVIRTRGSLWVPLPRTTSGLPRRIAVT